MREALIVWGGWSGHEPQECAHIIRDMLQEDGFKVYLEHDRSLCRSVDPRPVADRSDHDDVEDREGRGEESAAAVEGGVGIAGYHGGAGDAFRESVEYQFIIGGQWVAHPGNIIDYRVNVTRPDDPLMEGISDFPYTSEQYYMHVDPSNEVLATTTFSGEHASWIEGVVMPVVWKRKHGKGRVFYSSLGHVAKEFEVPEMRTIFRRGANWAAR